MPIHIHPDDDTVYACPGCDVSGEVYRRTDDKQEFDHPFRCHKCGHEFDDPVERPPKPKTPPPGEDDDGLPAQLDPDTKELIRSVRGS